MWVYVAILSLTILPHKTVASFGLLSTQYGCPYMEGMDWKTGMRVVSLPEDTVTWTTNIHLIGLLTKKDVQWHGCFSDSSQSVTWEPGNYCVLSMSEKCPEGLTLDGTSLSALGNATVVEATGVYKGTDNSILLPMCCSNQIPDENKETPMILPFSTPFYLIKADQTELCPNVAGHKISEENIKIRSGSEEVTVGLCFYSPQYKYEALHSSYCPAGWLYNGGYCYYFSNYTLPWFDGQAVCESMQANLVSITNPEEVNFLALEMDKRRTQTLEFYIGLYDIHKENIWTWVDKVPVEESFVNWNPNEPNDSLKKEDCTFYRIDTRNWNDIDCTQDVAFICKRVAVPDPIQLAYMSRVTSSSVADDRFAEFATDSSTDTCFQSRWEANQWIQIDLGQMFDVYAVLIITANYPLRAGAIHVGLAPDNFQHNIAMLCADDISTHHVASLVQCVNPVKGRFISITQGQSLEQVPSNLEICDLRVYAKVARCGKPIGVSTGEVSSVHLSASSSKPPHWAHLGRLNGGAIWCASTTDQQPYFQVSLPKVYSIHVIEISSGNYDGGVNTFTVYTGMDQDSLEPLMATLGHTKVFHNDMGSPTVHPLLDGIIAKVIQLNIEHYTGQPCLQVEFFGCPQDETGGMALCPMILGHPAVSLPRRSSGQLSLLFPIECSGYINSIVYYATSLNIFTIHTWEIKNNAIIGPVSFMNIMPVSIGRNSQELGFTVSHGFWLGIHSSDINAVPHGQLDDVGVLPSDLMSVMSFTIPSITSESSLSLELSNAVQSRLIYALSVDISADEDAYAVSCGGNVLSARQLTSPNFPGYYGQDRHCVWNISPKNNEFVSLDFTHFDLEDTDASGCADVLSLYDVQEERSELLNKLSWKVFPLVMLDSKHIKLKLTSCSRHSPQAATGFAATVNFQECAGCGVGSTESKLYCTQPCGYLATPNYPHLYPPNAKRHWHVVVQEGQYIKLELGILKVESMNPQCKQDYLEFYDYDFQGERKSIDVYCNAHPPPLALFSSWHQMALQFESDQEYSGSGFLATYSSVQFSIPESLHSKIRFEDGACPASWVGYKASCFRLSVLPQGTSWLDAESRCQKDQSHLVSIMDSQEMLVLHYLLTAVWAAKETTTYIGLTDSGKEGQFRWSDSRPMIYTSWANLSSADTPQPDGGELEDCAVIQLANLYSINQWHDVPCALNDVKQFVCKKQLPEEVQKVEVPSTSVKHMFNRTSLFECDSDEFIHEIYVCDGIPQCQNASDEANCLKCEPYQFSCGDGQCVHISKYCDFQQDCQNGADESHCVMPGCNKGEYQCTNLQCIPNRGRCNLIIDCTDGSDEQNCDTCQRPDTFQCYDGRCLPWQARCDGVKDCSGCTTEDERGCFNSPFSLCDDVIICDWRPLEGFGTLSLSHDLSPSSWSQESHSWSLSISYLGLATDDELLAVMDKSYRCEQHITFNCESAMNTSTWLSLTSGTTWEPLVYGHNCTFEENESCTVEVSDKSALPVKIVNTNTGCALGHQVPLNLSPLLCYTEVGTREVGKVMKCNNGQRTDTRWRCLFEFDQFGVQKGCRDMSHIQGCGQLKTQYTECKKSHLAPDYVGTKSVSASNITCQRWDMQTPHKHPYSLPEHHGEDSVSDVHNFCRNPDKGLPPFCFTLDTEVRYEPCDIPICADDTGETWAFDCPENYIRCPGDYCIPLDYVCDGEWHCPNGEDEQQCETYSCAGRFSCTTSQKCLPLNKLCDGVKDCDLGDDEELCNITCPSECDCSSLVFNCSLADIRQVPQNLNSHIRVLDLSHNYIIRLDEEEYLPYLARFRLNNNELTYIKPFQFKNMRNLIVLDLSHNDIKILPNKAFQNLINLQQLHLHGNAELEVIAPGAFESLKSLTYLQIKGKALANIDDSTFIGLLSLLELDLSNNKISYISENGFMGLPVLKRLILTGNDIRLISRQTFQTIPALESLRSDAFKLCCLAEQVPKEQCYPPQDPISTCEDLMSTSVLRSFLWILGVMALFGNVFVILWRLRYPSSNVPEVIINNLAISDLLMGVYMLIIAVVDSYYQGVFIEYSDQWRSSWLCKLAGFLGTFSSEGSVLFLCLLTVDRFINIMFPFGSFKLNRGGARLSASVVWLVAFVASALPLFPLPYFGDSFYGRSGVCLALPITSETPPGWEFSTAVFIGFNLLGFVVIALGYSIMYIAISRSGAQAAGGLQRRQQIKLARNMMIIVATDFVCWLPIICMGIAALTGAPISGEVYAWVIVFVLPVNSAINPILYTFSSLDLKSKIKRFFISNTSGDSHTESSQVSNTGKTLRSSPLVLSLDSKEARQTLRSFCGSPKTSTNQILHVLIQLIELLKILHDSGMVHGQLNIKVVLICITEVGPQVMTRNADLGQQVDSESEFSEDMYHLGTLFREVLQTVKAREMPRS